MSKIVTKVTVMVSLRSWLDFLSAVIHIYIPLLAAVTSQQLSTIIQETMMEIQRQVTITYSTPIIPIFLFLKK